MAHFPDGFKPNTPLEAAPLLPPTYSAPIEASPFSGLYLLQPHLPQALSNQEFAFDNYVHVQETHSTPNEFPPHTHLAIEVAPPPMLPLVPQPAPSQIDDQFTNESSHSLAESDTWSISYSFQTISDSEGYLEDLNASDHGMDTTPSLGCAGLSLTTTKTIVHQCLVWRGRDAVLMFSRDDIANALKNTQWNRPIFVTKCLYFGALWTGLVNPWDFGEREYRRLVTNCFLESVVFLNGTTLQELHDHPCKRLPFIS
jgi:hypothetical protein